MGKPGTRWGPTTTARERRVRLQTTEDLLTKHIRSGPVIDALCQEYGITRRLASRYITAVRRRWDREHGANPHRRRDELRARVENLYTHALERQKAVVLGKGDEASVEYVPDPDIPTALRAIKQLADLDGVKAPEQHEHAHTVDVRLAGKPTAELVAELVSLEGLDAVPEEIRALLPADGGDDE